MFKRLPLVLSALFVLVTVSVALSADVDPQSLPGEYSGTFTASFLPQSSWEDRAELTIKEVNGNVVSGAVYLATSVINPVLNKDLPFRGTLVGNTITVQWKQSVLTMTINGKIITGTIVGRYTTNFTVQKR